MRWTPDKIEWVVDGKTERTVERKYTFNATSNQYEFPQTPARVQLSLWPGGLASNAKGTIDWAGGEIDWNAPDIQDPGFFYASVDSVEVKCYSASSGPGTNKNKSYSYDNLAGTNNTVVDGDKDTVLGSLSASGLNPDLGKKKEKESKTGKESSSSTDDEEKPKNTAAQIPGGGSVGQDHSDEGDSSDDSGNDSGSGGDSGDSGSAPANTADCDVSSFHADCNGDKSSSSDSSKDGDGEGSAPRAGASALAVIIAACALFWL